MNLSKALLILSILFAGFAEAATWRQEAGYYEATSFWAGPNNKQYDSSVFGPFSNNQSGDPKTVSIYTKTSFEFELSESLKGNFGIEYTHFELNDFTATGKNDGYSISGVSSVDVGFTYLVVKSDFQSLDVRASVDAPGDTSQDVTRFVAISDGVTKYNLGFDYNHNIGSSAVVGFGYTYVYRPGIFEDGTANHNHPNHQIFDLSYTQYLGSYVVGLSFNKQISQSGLDVATPSTGWTSAARQFPATQEEHEAFTIFGGTMISQKYWMDVSFYQKVRGRNTDKGRGINFALQMDI